MNKVRIHGRGLIIRGAAAVSERRRQPYRIVTHVRIGARRDAHVESFHLSQELASFPMTRSKRPHTFFARAIYVGIAVAGLLVLLVLIVGRDEERLHVSGFIEADEVRVGSRVGGRVSKVFATEGQVVQRGELLVELEPFDLLERKAEAHAVFLGRKSAYEKLVAGFRAEEIAQAEARVAQLQAQLTKFENGPRKQELDAARAEVELADSELALATLKHQRTESLFGQGSATRQQLDEAVSELRVARARRQVKQQQLALLEEGTRQEDLDEARAQLRETQEAAKLVRNGYRREEIAEAQAAMQAAEADLSAIEQQIGELKISAPVDGTVEAIELQPGDLVAANAPVLSLVDLSRLWVRAYVPENRMNLAAGQAVTVTVDSYPAERFAGEITFIARQAEFTPSNVQTPEERSKQVFRIKVTLREGLERLRPGMAADVWFRPEGDGP